MRSMRASRRSRTWRLPSWTVAELALAGSGWERQRRIDQAAQGVQRGAGAQAGGLGPVGRPEDDLADGVGQLVLPQAPAQVRGGEQLRVVLGQPGQQR